MASLIIISSPSGGGKNSVINALMTRIPRSVRLVTTTTRPMRPGEQEGHDYYFISKETFQQKREQGQFLECNEYAGNWYGTDKQLLEQLLATYDVVFSQIEVHGRSIIKEHGIPHLAIFLMPESLDILRKRIEQRGGLTKEIIDERLDIAKQEIASAATYDVHVVNKEGAFHQTVQQVLDISKAYIEARTQESIS